MLRTFASLLTHASPRRGCGHWAFFRVLLGLALVTLSFGARTASAATRVPMCGEHAQTVMAPPTSRPLPLSELIAGPCEGQGAEQFTNGLPDRHKEPKLTNDSVPRLPPVVHRSFDAARAHSSLDTSENGERPAHTRGIERPPR